MKLTVVGCSPAWPNPGGAQSGYLVEGYGTLLLDCGAGVLAKLRLREELAAGRLDRHLPLAPRPLGRPRPLGLGQHVRARPGGCRSPSSGSRPGGSSCSDCSASGWGRRRCSGTRSSSPSTRKREPFKTAAGLTITRDRGSALHDPDLRLPGHGRRHDAGVLGRLGAERRARRGRARRRPLPLRGDAGRRRPRRPPRAGTCPPTRRSPPSTRRAPSGCWSHTGRRSSLCPPGSSALRTGSSSTCRAGRPAPPAVPDPPADARKTITPSRPPTIRPTGTNSQTAPSAGFGGAVSTEGARGSAVRELHAAGRRPVRDEPVRRARPAVVLERDVEDLAVAARRGPSGRRRP